MVETIENSRNEFKIKLTDKLEQTVIGFLNSKDGGNLYIGINDSGVVHGLNGNIDELQRQKEIYSYNYC